LPSRIGEAAFNCSSAPVPSRLATRVF
jgi:hypothetical protein